MKKIVHYIGLDVHKETIAVAIAPEGSTEVRSYGIRPLLEHPPQRQVRQKLELPLRRKPEQEAAVIKIEWIACGLTEASFWTAPRRLIATLESQVRSWKTKAALPGSIESE